MFDSGQSETKIGGGSDLIGMTLGDIRPLLDRLLRSIVVVSNAHDSGKCFSRYLEGHGGAWRGMEGRGAGSG